MTSPLQPLNYYEILNCQPSDSVDDIKKSYQALVLKHHPDKQCSNDQNNVTNDVERFYQIDEAWKLLRDPEMRRKYDAEMQQHKFNDEPIVHAKVYQSDFEFDSESQCLIYPCRCGGFFVLPDDCIEPNDCDTIENNAVDKSTSKNLDENNADEIYIECDECSFVVQLLSNKNRR